MAKLTQEELNRWENFQKKFKKEPPKNAPIMDAEGNVVDLMSSLLKDLDETYPELAEQIKKAESKRGGKR